MMLFDAHAALANMQECAAHPANRANPAKQDPVRAENTPPISRLAGLAGASAFIEGCDKHAVGPKSPVGQWQACFDAHLADLRAAHPNGLPLGTLEAIAFARCQSDWIAKHLPPYPVPFDQVAFDNRMAQSRAALIAAGLAPHPPLEAVDRGLYDTRSRNAIRGFIGLVEERAALMWHGGARLLSNL